MSAIARTTRRTTDSVFTTAFPHADKDHPTVAREAGRGRVEKATGHLSSGCRPPQFQMSVSAVASHEFAVHGRPRRGCRVRRTV